MPVIKTVGIISKPNSPAAGSLVPKLIEWLQQSRHHGAHRRAHRHATPGASQGCRANRCPKAATW